MVFLTQMVLVFTRTLERWPIERYPGDCGVAIAAESALLVAASEKDRKVVHALGK